MTQMEFQTKKTSRVKTTTMDPRWRIKFQVGWRIYQQEKITPKCGITNELEQPARNERTRLEHCRKVIRRLWIQTNQEKI